VDMAKHHALPNNVLSLRWHFLVSTGLGMCYVIASGASGAIGTFSRH